MEIDRFKRKTDALNGWSDIRGLTEERCVSFLRAPGRAREPLPRGHGVEACYALFAARGAGLE